MNNQAFELRRHGLMQMQGRPEYLDLYDQEFMDLLNEIKTDEDEDRKKVHLDRIKSDGRHQIAYLMTLAYRMVSDGEVEDEQG